MDVERAAVGTSLPEFRRDREKQMARHRRIAAATDEVLARAAAQQQRNEERLQVLRRGR